MRMCAYLEKYVSTILTWLPSVRLKDALLLARLCRDPGIELKPSFCRPSSSSEPIGKREYKTLLELPTVSPFKVLNFLGLSQHFESGCS